MNSRKHGKKSQGKLPTLEVGRLGTTAKGVNIYTLYQRTEDGRRLHIDTSTSKSLLTKRRSFLLNEGAFESAAIPEFMLK